VDTETGPPARRNCPLSTSYLASHCDFKKHPSRQRAIRLFGSRLAPKIISVSRGWCLCSQVSCEPRPASGHEPPLNYCFARRNMGRARGPCPTCPRGSESGIPPRQHGGTIVAGCLFWTFTWVWLCVHFVLIRRERTMQANRTSHLHRKVRCDTVADLSSPVATGGNTSRARRRSASRGRFLLFNSNAPSRPGASVHSPSRTRCRLYAVMTVLFWLRSSISLRTGKDPPSCDGGGDDGTCRAHVAAAVGRVPLRHRTAFLTAAPSAAAAAPLPTRIGPRNNA